MRTIKQLVIHHSAGRSGNAAEFRKEHLARGWADIGYHAVICNSHGGADGEIQPGRREDRDGAGVFGNNHQKLQICLVGNFQERDPGFTGRPSPAQLNTLGRWLAHRSRTYGVTAAAAIVGHREITIPGHGTLCPGTLMPLHEIRLWFTAQQPHFRDESYSPLATWLARN